MKPRIKVKPCPGGHLGEIHMPMTDGGHIVVGALGWSPWKALKKAASAARKLANNPAVQTFLPPQVVVAIKTAEAMSAMGKKALRALKKHPHASPAQRKMAEVLLRSPDLPEVMAPPSPAPGPMQEPPPPAEAMEEEESDEMGAVDPLEALAVQAWGRGTFAKGSFDND